MGAYSSEIKQIMDIIFGVIIGIIGIVGLLYGGYTVWSGFSGDRPEDTRKGIIVIVVTVMAIVLMLLLKTPILKLAGIS